MVTATITGRERLLAECVNSVAGQTRKPHCHLIGNGDGRPEADVLNELLVFDCDAYVVLNDDDLLLPEYLRKCSELIESADVVYAWPRVEGRAYSFDAEAFTELPMTALVRKTLFDALGGYRSRRENADFSDADFWVRASGVGARLVHIPERLWVYRFHGDNMSMNA